VLEIIIEILKHLFTHHIEIAISMTLVTWALTESVWLSYAGIQNSKLTKSKQRELRYHNMQHTYIGIAFSFALFLYICSNIIGVYFTEYHELVPLFASTSERISEDYYMHNFITIIEQISMCLISIVIALSMRHAREEEMPGTKVNEIMYGEGK